MSSNDPFSWGDLAFDPLVPPPLVLLLALVSGVLTVGAYRATGDRIPRGQNLCLLAVRLLGLFLVLAILLQPSRIASIPSDPAQQVTLVAVDGSRSMRQTDAGQRSRLDAAREILRSAGLAARSESTPGPAGLRLFRFGADAVPWTDSIDRLNPDDRTTRFHQSLQTVFGSLADRESATALFLLTDGHDFELANVAQTASLARSRQIPIYAVALGGEGNVRDLSVRITGFQAFHYARQTIRLDATIRVLGCPYETLKVVLSREGKPVQSRTVAVREEAQIPVRFEVTEPAAGQFEYRIAVEPVAGEADVANNHASIYCNVVDKRIRVLALEGEPYWDSTFMLRSLRRNDKVQVDSVVNYGRDKVRVLRTEETATPFRTPKQASEWNDYDVVILGRGIDALLDAEQTRQLQEWVEQSGGAVVFSRGGAFANASDAALQPIRWGALVARPGAVRVGREGQGLPPLRLMAAGGTGDPALPPPLGVYESTDRKPLTATLAVSETRAEFPVLVHRRAGAGQVLAIGIDGLWRWAFGAGHDGRTTVYDRFWDQTVLWLMGGRDLAPESAFTFRADTGNVPLGEKIQFRVVARDPTKLPSTVPLVIRREGVEVARLDASRVPGSARLVAEYLPEQPGRFEVAARLPDASQPVVRFATHADDAEDTEVAADPAYLRRLCEATRGRLLRPEEFADTLKQVKAVPRSPSTRTHRISLWDRAWVFWAIGGLFGLDWYLRRRWGLC